MNLNLSVTKGETSVSLILENTSNEYATDTVNKVFGFFGSSQVIVAPKIVTQQEEKKVDIQPAKTIEKINSERTLMQPLAEKLSAALGMNTPAETITYQGVATETIKEDINEPIEGRWPYSKYRDEKEYFKCRYYCPCGHKANHYIEEGRESVSCFSCKTELKVRDANEYEQQKLQTRFMAVDAVKQIQVEQAPVTGTSEVVTTDHLTEWKMRKCLTTKSCKDCGETISPGERFDSYYQKGKARAVYCPECYEENHKVESAV